MTSKLVTDRKVRFALVDCGRISKNRSARDGIRVPLPLD